MADDLDRLAEHLDPTYQERIDSIMDLLREITRFPVNYREVVAKARQALTLYEDLINEIGDREDDFEQ